MNNVIIVLFHFSLSNRVYYAGYKDASFANKLLTFLENTNNRMLIHFAEGVFIS